jgi:hypothetical protein
MSRRIILPMALAIAAVRCSPDDDSPGFDVGDGLTDGPAADTALDVGADTPSDLPGDDSGIVDWIDDVDCHQDIDIVFVIDVSTSMSWVLGTLRDEIVAVWDYTVAMSDDPDFTPHFGLVVFVDDVKVTNDGDPYANAIALRDEFDYWQGFCGSNAQPGGSSCSNQDCPENTLDALAAAAESFAWREGALHVAILATDDTFKEHPQKLCSSLMPSIQVQHTYSETIVELIDRQIRVGAFAAHTSAACGIPANKEPGLFAPWNGQPSIPQQTGSQVWDLHDVQSGTISLTEAVQGFVLEEWCTDFI